MSSADTYFTHFTFVIRFFSCIMLWLLLHCFISTLIFVKDYTFTWYACCCNGYLLANSKDHLHWWWSKCLLHWIKRQYSLCLILPNAASVLSDCIIALAVYPHIIFLHTQKKSQTFTYVLLDSRVWTRKFKDNEDTENHAEKLKNIFYWQTA